MRLFIRLGIFALLVGCGTEVVIEEKPKEGTTTTNNAETNQPPVDTGADAVAPPTFDDDIKGILLASGCTVSGCHLSPPDDSKPDFEDYAKTKAKATAGGLITTGHYGKTISAEDKTKIEAWITAGHPENSSGSDDGGGSGGGTGGESASLTCTIGEIYYDNCIGGTLLTGKGCTGCHTTGNQAPDLSTYAATKDVADNAAMYPKFATGHTDDPARTWSAQEKGYIETWISNDAPENNSGGGAALSSFATDIMGLFQPKGCLNGNCHNAGGNNIIITDYAVTKAAADTGAGNARYMNLVNGMGGLTWNAAEQAAINKWINDGKLP